MTLPPQLIRNEELAYQSFLDQSSFEPPPVMDVRAFGSWMSAPTCLFFLGFRGPDRTFEPGRLPGYPPGRLRDVQPVKLKRGWEKEDRTDNSTPLIALLMERKSSSTRQFYDTFMAK